jgi:hypothetical protein
VPLDNPSGGEGIPISVVSTTPVGRELVVATGPAADRPSRPSPLRSATPAGGSRRIGPATQSIDRRQAAAIDMALIDLPSEDEPEGEVSEEPPSTPPVVEEVQTPSGLPLLGAFAPDLRGSARTPRPEGEALPNAAHAPTASSRLADAKRPDKDKGPTRARSAARYGLGLAYALAFTLLLPDITAAVQRAEARRIRRPRIRRSLLGRAFGPRRK